MSAGLLMVVVPGRRYSSTRYVLRTLTTRVPNTSASIAKKPGVPWGGIPPQGTPGFFAIDALVLGTLVVSVRSTYRVLEYLLPGTTTMSSPALIYGAGQDGQLILRELRRHPHLGLQPIGFLDDDPTLYHRMVQQVPVLGSGEEITGVMDRQPVAALILASSRLQRSRVDRAISICQARGIPVLRG